MRILYVVPIIHHDADQGRFGDTLRRVREKRLGARRAQAQTKIIENFWHLCQRRIKRTVKDFQGIHIYQDSLACEIKDQAVKNLLSGMPLESPNDRLLRELLRGGAILEGTEDGNLLKEFLSIYVALTKIKDEGERERKYQELRPRIEELIQKRDKFIAKRINETLPENGRGIFLIGRKHQVDKALARLEKDGLLSSPIQVIHL